jgi:hypothetical protein
MDDGNADLRDPKLLFQPLIAPPSLPPLSTAKSQNVVSRTTERKSAINSSSVHGILTPQQGLKFANEEHNNRSCCRNHALLLCCLFGTFLIAGGTGISLIANRNSNSTLFAHNTHSPNFNIPKAPHTTQTRHWLKNKMALRHQSFKSQKLFKQPIQKPRTINNTRKK